MLLKVKTRTIDNQTALEVYEIGGKLHVYKAPFKPYYYAPFDVNSGERQQLEKTLLSTMQKKQLWKVAFPNTYALKDCRVDGGMEDHIPYDQRVAIDVGYKQASGAPSHDAFDLEMESSRGMFPNAAYDKITAISYVGENFKECKTIGDVPEYELIHWFIDTVKKRNPDALDTYFGSFADWPWLELRAKVNNIALSVGRDGSKPYLSTRTFNSGKKVGEEKFVDIGGRVHFDVWKEVDADQTIFGIKNKQLKTVAKWFGLGPVIEVDRSQMARLSNEQLREYCLSDANLTYELAKIYIRNLLPLAEYLEIPLNMVLDRTPSHPSNYVLRRHLGKLNIVVDKGNSERYPEFYQEGRKAYQGALINLIKPGVYENIGKLDFKSMYPSILVCFNYSPESIYDTHIHGTENESICKYCEDVNCSECSLNSLGAWVDIKGNKISVWDKYLGIITVKANLDCDSITRKVIKEWMAWRSQLKAEQKKHPEKLELESQQWAIKVLMNAMSGYHGMQWGCGCYPIIAHVTGHGRYWIDEATRSIIANGATAIERDTDGIYYVGETDYASQVTELIRGLIPEQFDKSVIKVDSEKYSAGIFYDEKGYVLRKTDGKLVFHGSGLKGRHIPRLCDKALERVAVAILEKEDVADLLSDIGRNIKSWTQADFIMTAELKKRPDEYSNKNQYGKLIQKMKSANIPVAWGSEIQYVKTRDRGFLPLGVSDQINVDYGYYMQRIAAVVERVLRVTHSYNKKQIVTCLKGGRVEPLKNFEVKTLC